MLPCDSSSLLKSRMKMGGWGGMTQDGKHLRSALEKIQLVLRQVETMLVEAIILTESIETNVSGKAIKRVMNRREFENLTADDWSIIGSLRLQNEFQGIREKFLRKKKSAIKSQEFLGLRFYGMNTEVIENVGSVGWILGVFEGVFKRRKLPYRVCRQVRGKNTYHKIMKIVKK